MTMKMSIEGGDPPGRMTPHDDGTDSDALRARVHPGAEPAPPGKMTPNQPTE